MRIILLSVITSLFNTGQSPTRLFYMNTANLSVSSMTVIEWPSLQQQKYIRYNKHEVTNNCMTMTCICSESILS